MFDDPTCWHRWESDTPDPGPCQCILYGGHDGPHRCCCGATDDNLRARHESVTLLASTPTGGTYTLTLGGQTTAPIAHNASCSEIAQLLADFQVEDAE